MNLNEMKRYLIYFNMFLFCAVIWYFVAELLLTLVWRVLWH